MHAACALSRRRLLALGGTVAGTLLLPTAAGADSTLVDPYIGAIPFIFPLADGAYEAPLQNNWHGLREGQVYPWNHRGSTALRAHDGVDLYPQSDAPLPPVFAPVQGKVVAVCTRSDNTLDAKVSYRASGGTPPPWDYHSAIDNVAQLPLYGNFVWLLSTELASAGYFVFFCHLQNEATLQALVPDQVVSVTTPLALMGDTGNAAGFPQLHVEVHYPAGMTYTCGECSPEKKLTTIDSYASLLRATPRPALPTVKPATPIAPGQRLTGTLAGQSGGAFATFTVADPGSATRVLTLNYGPFDAGQAHALGLNVYQNGAKLASSHGQATGLGDGENSSAVAVAVTPNPASGPLLLQVYNYTNDVVTFTLSVA